MTEAINILISLHKGYGLGDAVQMSAVLRHVARYRPTWTIDYQAEEGRHCVGRGIVANTLAYGEPYPHSHYDAEVQICLYDTWASWGDRPNTRVSSALHECFGLPWDPECGRYQVIVRPEVAARAIRFLGAMWGGRVIDKFVAVHYKGDSSPHKKDLSDSQADSICDHIIALGRTPLLLDWRSVSPVGRRFNVLTTGGYEFSRAWGADAERNCAVIAQCQAFVGIDSGPSKCAGATDTPVLVTWTGHHPAPFHDPAPNTTHLVPVGYHGLEPVQNDVGVVRWFEANYNVRQYESDPVVEIKKWLTEVLR